MTLRGTGGSRPRWLAGLAAMVIVLTLPAAATGEQTGTRSGGHHVRHDFVPGTAVANGGQVHGMALETENQPFDLTLRAIPELAADGVNLVNLYITEYQANLHANTIVDGTFTPTTAEVSAAVSLAHSYGMAVELMPVVETQDGFHWRGAIWPSNVSAWFASYTAMIDRWAQLAQQDGVEIFCIGSELEHMQQYTADWEQVAASVDAVYQGLTTYMADNNTVGIRSYHGLNVKFWRSVDLIGQSPYFTLSDATTPSVKSLVKAWQTVWLPKERRLSRKWGRPILFDEIGYRSVDRAAYQPYLHSGGTPNEQAQANAYQALIDATTGLSYIRGVVFFRWGLADPVPPLDTSYDPAGKLAECAMAKSWTQSGTGTPLACTLAAMTDL